MKSCAGADRAFDVNFAGVFLNNAVRNGEAKAGAAPLAKQHVFGGEKRIVDALEMFRRNARAGIGNNCFNVAINQRGNAQSSAEQVSAASSTVSR